MQCQKEEDLFTRKSKELVGRIVKNTAEITRDAKDAKDAYQESCKILEMDQGKFINASKELQGSMAKALERAVAYGEAMAVERMYTSISQSVTQPSEPTKAKTKAMPKYGKGEKKGKSEEKVEKKVRGKRQPAEEDEGLEWSEHYYEDDWKADRAIRSNETYPPHKYKPFSKEWTSKLGKTLWDLAHRGFAKKKDEMVPEYPFPWGLESESEFYEIQEKLEKFAVSWTFGPPRKDKGHCYPGKPTSVEGLV